MLYAVGFYPSAGQAGIQDCECDNSIHRCIDENSQMSVNPMTGKSRPEVKPPENLVNAINGVMLPRIFKFIPQAHLLGAKGQHWPPPVCSCSYHKPSPNLYQTPSIFYLLTKWLINHFTTTALFACWEPDEMMTSPWMSVRALYKDNGFLLQLSKKEIQSKFKKKKKCSRQLI